MTYIIKLHKLLFSKFADTLTKEDLRKKDDMSIEPKKQKSKRKRVSSDESDDIVKKDNSKRLRVVSDDDSDDDKVKKNKAKAKRLRIGSDDSDEVVKKKKKAKSKRSRVVSDDDSDDVKIDTPKKSVVISDESDDDVVAGTESPDDLMVVDVRLGRGRARADDASGENVGAVEDDSTEQASRTDSRNQKTDKERRKSERKEIPPAIVNDDGICFSNNGQYCLDMSQRYELSEFAIEWTRALCDQNKVWAFFH